MNELWTNIGHLGVKQQGLPNLQDKIYMFWPLLERLYDNCRNATMVKSVWSKPMISIRQLRATVNIMHLYAGVAPVILDLISSHYQVKGKCIYLPPLCETDVRQILYTIHQYVIHIWWGSPCYFGMIITSWPHSQAFVNFILQGPTHNGLGMRLYVHLVASSVSWGITNSASSLIDCSFSSSTESTLLTMATTENHTPQDSSVKPKTTLNPNVHVSGMED